MLDASIYGNLGRGVKSVQEYDAEAQANQANKLALMLHKAQYDEYGRKVADDNALRQVVSQFGTDDSANEQALYRAGRFGEAQSYRKSNLDAAETRAKTAHQNAQTTGLGLDQNIKAHDYHVQLLGSVNDPAQVPSWVQAGVDAKVFKSEEAPGIMQRFQAAMQQPGGFAQWKQAALQGGMTATDQLKQKQLLEIANQTDATSRSNNAATNATSRANNANTVGATMRGQNIARDTAMQGGSVQMDAQGNMVMVPNKFTPGAPIQATPIVGGDGKPMQKGEKTKEIPAAVSAKIMEGKQGLRNIDEAIASLEKNPGAVGITNAIPGMQTVRGQYDSPENIATRAKIANIGSLKLHDRSGAAVSASEFPRLAPFIPSASDSPQAAATKLREMKKIAEQELGLFSETYGAGQGYKATPLLSKPAGDIHSQADAILRGN